MNVNVSVKKVSTITEMNVLNVTMKVTTDQVNQKQLSDFSLRRIRYLLHLHHYAELSIDPEYRYFNNLIRRIPNDIIHYLFTFLPTPQGVARRQVSGTPLFLLGILFGREQQTDFLEGNNKLLLKP